MAESTALFPELPAGRRLDVEIARVLTAEQLRPDPALVADGWERRFIADVHRAQEAVDLYRKLGFEARAEPVKHVELGEECGDCAVVTAFRFKTVYTRRPKDWRPARPRS